MADSSRPDRERAAKFLQLCGEAAMRVNEAIHGTDVIPGIIGMMSVIAISKEQYPKEYAMAEDFLRSPAFPEFRKQLLVVNIDG